MGLLRAVRNQLRPPAATLSALTDSIVIPTLPDTDLPPASVVTWVACHFAAVGVYFSSVVVGSALSDLWRPLVITLWLLGLSGLCWRLVCQLLFRGRDNINRRCRKPRQAGTSRATRFLRDRRSPSRIRVASDSKLGSFIMLTYATYLAVTGLGPLAIGGFLAVLAFTTGLRFAGLDALAGRVREPWHYIRAVISVRGLLTFVVIIVVSAGVFVFAALTLDPFLRKSEQTVEGILGLDLSRWDQFQILVIGTALLTPPALMVCEAIAAVSRHEAALVEQVGVYERRLERDGIARELHDGVILSTLREVGILATNEGQKKLIDGLDSRLRDLHLRRLAARGDRSIRVSLRRPAEQANHRGLALRLDSDQETLGLVVDDDFGRCEQREVREGSWSARGRIRVEVDFDRQTIRPLAQVDAERDVFDLKVTRLVFLRRRVGAPVAAVTERGERLADVRAVVDVRVVEALCPDRLPGRDGSQERAYCDESEHRLTIGGRRR